MAKKLISNLSKNESLISTEDAFIKQRYAFTLTKAVVERHKNALKEQGFPSSWISKSVEIWLIMITDHMENFLERRKEVFRKTGLVLEYGDFLKDIMKGSISDPAMAEKISEKFSEDLRQLTLKFTGGQNRL